MIKDFLVLPQHFLCAAQTLAFLPGVDFVHFAVFSFSPDFDSPRGKKEINTFITKMYIRYNRNETLYYLT